MIEHRRADDPDIQTIRELAEHGAEIKHLQADMDKVIRDMDEMKETLREISKTLSEAKGGWHMLLLVGGAGASLGAASAWLFDLIKH